MFKFRCFHNKFSPFYSNSSKVKYVKNKIFISDFLLCSVDSNSSDTTNSDLSYGKHSNKSSCFLFIIIRYCTFLVPNPTNLHVEKFLGNNILIVWNPPLSNIEIIGYQIILNNKLYKTIQVNEPTQTVIENINSIEQYHRICIRTMTQFGLSRDQECTLLLTDSNDLCYTPTDLRIDRIKQTSAIVSWWPASNDLIHILFVNHKQLQTFQPGIHRFKLAGLSPNTLYKITVQSQLSAISNTEQQLTASIDFRTTSFSMFKQIFNFFVSCFVEFKQSLNHRISC